MSPVGGEDGDTEESQLLGVFPAEVWLNILGNVKNNAADFQRISNSSPYFRTLLGPVAVQVLFPEVLQIVLQQQPRLYTQEPEGIQSQMERQLLPPKDLLTLRLVCHAWKMGVEHALHDPNHMLLSDNEKEEKQDLMKEKHNFPWIRKVDPNLSTYDRFESVEDFTRFQQHFSGTHHHVTAPRNPFFCQFVEFSLPMSFWDFPPYLEACLEFLRKFGGHVRYCSIALFDFFDDEYEQHRQFYCTDLKQILALMPNLKACHFTATDIPIPESSLPQLQSSLEESMFPMPELKQLQKINAEGLPLPFFMALLQRNPQVSVVSDGSIHYLPPKTANIKSYLEQLPNLTTLEFRLSRASEFHAFRRSRAVVACQLTTLHLDFRDGILWFAEVGLKHLFYTLEAQFSGTLTELWLDVSPTKDEAKGLVFRLPHLKKLVFIMEETITPLDFLQYLKDSLEQLTVGCYCINEERPINRREPFPQELPFPMSLAKENDKTIKLYQFWVEHQKSNVWSLFPKLKLLRTEGYGEPCLSTRAEWIAAQRK